MRNGQDTPIATRPLLSHIVDTVEVENANSTPPESNRVAHRRPQLARGVRTLLIFGCHSSTSTSAVNTNCETRRLTH